ncbi:hypothetical protein N0V92_010758 [Colletotrichum tropicale]|nr:hypothetical protein N0V92_010758 [Colletotrichum tropicale]
MTQAAMAITATPPTTPPTIAPVFEEEPPPDGGDVSLGEESVGMGSVPVTVPPLLKKPASSVAAIIVIVRVPLKLECAHVNRVLKSNLPASFK